MNILRTPEARFASLPDYPFAPHYRQVTADLRLHYVDEGPRDAAPVLMLHGEPTWWYLYRHMIGAVAAAGLRVLASDLIGFGKSDKPEAQATIPTLAKSRGCVIGWRRWTFATSRSSAKIGAR